MDRYFILMGGIFLFSLLLRRQSIRIVENAEWVRNVIYINASNCSNAVVLTQNLSVFWAARLQL